MKMSTFLAWLTLLETSRAVFTLSGIHYTQTPDRYSGQATFVEKPSVQALPQGGDGPEQKRDQGVLAACAARDECCCCCASYQDSIWSSGPNFLVSSVSDLS